ncbi:tetratricopeptide repeat protein [Ktedonobacteria bacterium brp13]|nr:tetratricopeptide repeat protein [Ktedonobacteria bacterium brp13]
MHDSIFSVFGELLRLLRVQKRINQQQLADKLSVHRNTISKWERGVCLPISKTIVLELAYQLQLDKHDTQQLLEASLTSSTPRWYLPFPNSPFFTGRDALLDELHELFSQNAVSHRSYALSGLGGIGKTQVAIEYAYRHVYDYSAILWIAAEAGESMIASFTAIIDILHLSARRDQNHIISTIHQWLNEHNEWLLIFDNIEDLGLIKPFMSVAHNGAILLTTRLQNLGSIAQTINLEPMTQDEGSSFLLRRSKLSSLDDGAVSLPPLEIQAAQTIVALMDGLPLALDQAGAYIDATQCNLQDYLQLFQTSWQRLLDERDAHSDHLLSVSRTFTLAFEQVKRNSPQAAELLTVCAFLSSAAISETFFSEGARHLGPMFEELAVDPFQFNAAIKTLQTYSLVQRDANMHTLTIHRLVQAVIKERLPEEIQSIWTTRIIRAMHQLFPVDEKTQVDYWQISERLLPHALVCITLGEQWNTDEDTYIALMCHVSTYLSACVRYGEAEELYKQALHIGKSSLGLDHYLMTEVLYGLAMLYFKQDKYEEAESLYLQALSMRERAQETESLPVANILFGLGSLYHRQGQYEEAEPLYQRALRIREQILGVEHSQVASLLNNLAELYREKGKYKEAESLCQRALRISEQGLGSEHSQVGVLLNNLAELYREQGKYAEAESLYRRTLRIWEKWPGSEHPRISYPLYGLAELFRAQDKYVEAELLYQRALRIWERELGQDHSLVAGPLDGLAELYRVQGKYIEAEPLYLRALQIRIQTLGLGHPEVAVTLCHLAHFYQLKQQPMEALELYQQALAILKRTLGPTHPKTVITFTAYTNLQQVLEHR